MTLVASQQHPIATNRFERLSRYSPLRIIVKGTLMQRHFGVLAVVSISAAGFWNGSEPAFADPMVHLTFDGAFGDGVTISGTGTTAGP